jgi:hypothetical protein
LKYDKLIYRFYLYQNRDCALFPYEDLKKDLKYYSLIDSTYAYQQYKLSICFIKLCKLIKKKVLKSLVYPIFRFFKRMREGKSQ